MTAPEITIPADILHLVYRLGDLRIDQRADGPDFDRFEAVAAGLTPTEAARMANRLRAGVAEQGRWSGYDTTPVPASPLGEVWDAPAYVWQWHGTHHLVTAMSVTPIYIGTDRAGYYGGCQDGFGTQVVARASTCGVPDAYGVFWRYETPDYGWRQVTGELSHNDMVAWHGHPLPFHKHGSVTGPFRAWLDTVAGLPVGAA